MSCLTTFHSICWNVWLPKTEMHRAQLLKFPVPRLRSLSFLVKSYFHFLPITIVFNLLPKACLHLARLKFEAMRYFHITLRIKCPYFPAFGLNTERYSDQNNSEYGHFLRSCCCCCLTYLKSVKYSIAQIYLQFNM